MTVAAPPARLASPARHPSSTFATTVVYEHGGGRKSGRGMIEA